MPALPVGKAYTHSFYLSPYGMYDYLPTQPSLRKQPSRGKRTRDDDDGDDDDDDEEEEVVSDDDDDEEEEGGSRRSSRSSSRRGSDADKGSKRQCSRKVIRYKEPSSDEEGQEEMEVVAVDEMEVEESENVSSAGSTEQVSPNEPTKHSSHHSIIMPP